MTTTSTKYVPFDPLRICDICGDLQRKSTMRRLRGGMWACPNEPQWRDAVELSAANARQKPFRILPVKDAKPENWSSPDSYEGDDGEILNFIARMVAAGTRYENVASGDLAPLTGNLLQAYGWSAQYLYGMIAENKRPLRMINLAKSSLTQIANTLLTRQVGTTLGASTTAASGAFLESGASAYVTQDAASCGLALLYAYNVFGTASYLTAANLAASYLRNVQSIGKCAVFFTSSDSAGTARLYTGGVCSQVSTAFGGDPSERFYSNHQFYPGDLLTLQFWKLLLTVNGDQTVGTAGVPDGFVTSPAQLLSTSISEMRTFWTEGVRDSAGETYTGLSSTTPREFFNAYPASKPNFTPGTGRWEFFNGDASTGTDITAQNFAMALGSLYATEGASAQVVEVNDWLRSFTSNPEFEIPANESPSQLARSVLGTFDATAAPSTLLTVRDADNAYAATKKNGSGLYDWGAFGLLAPLWGNRSLSSFVESRKLPLGRNQRFLDGQRSDGDHFDWITLRGLSGLSYQTAFRTNLSGSSPGSSPFAIDSSTPTPPMEGLVFWVKGDAGVHRSGSNVTGWDDQSAYRQNLDASNAGSEPTIGTDVVAGIPGVVFPTLSTNPIDPSLTKFLGRSSNLRASDGSVFGIGTGEHTTRTVFAVIRPRTYLNNSIMQTGGFVCSFRGAENPAQKSFQCVFFLQAFFNFFEPIFEVYSTDGPYAVFNIRGPNTPGSTYQDRVLLTEWSSSYPAISVNVNGSAVTLNPTSISAGQADGGALLGTDGFTVGNLSNGTRTPNFQGTIFEILIWDRALAGDDLIAARNYASSRYNLGLVNLAMVNDAVRAAQFGAAFRINPSDPMQV